ncbi:FkbM family methyltransferase [Sphaerisporangium sp. NPDC051017]|uniref:FkbM family methyltransferase n=1 Tax=Sphaerisporangium sp. NPDC051017 TaxID=3154636 RepID=UPI00343B1D1C
MLDRRTAPWGDTIWFEPSDISLDPQFLETGVSRPRELDALAAIVRPGDLIIDAGASLGYLTCYLAHLAGPSGRVHAIEPSTAMADLLERNVTGNGYSNVTISRLALGARDGHVDLWLSSSDLGRHSFYAANVLNLGGSELVEQLTADQYWRQRLACRPVGLFKLDVEGAEQVILGSASGLLSACREVWMEFWPEGIAAAGGDPYDALTLLLRSGFALTGWDLVTGEHQPVSDPRDLEAVFTRLARWVIEDGQDLSPILYIHAHRP